MPPFFNVSFYFVLSVELENTKVVRQSHKIIHTPVMYPKDRMTIKQTTLGDVGLLNSRIPFFFVFFSKHPLFQDLTHFFYPVYPASPLYLFVIALIPFIFTSISNISKPSNACQTL